MNLTIRRTLSAVALTTAVIFTSIGFANPVQCSYGSLTRNIEVVYSDPGQPVPCEVIYNKSMESSVQTLWRANSEPGYCEAQAEALIDKLSNFGWHCEAVASSAAQLPAELEMQDQASAVELEPTPAPNNMEMLGDPQASDISEAVEEAASND